MVKKTLLLSLILLLAAGGPGYAQQPTGENQTEERPDETGRDLNLQFQVGFNALNDGELLEATSRFKRAVATDTEIPRAYFWLGKTYFYQGFNDSAVQVLQRAETFPVVRDQARAELAMHRERYRPDTFGFGHEWNYVGLIDGNKYDESRNTNPSALEAHPYGGWYSSSYRADKILRYSEEGRVIKTWKGFNNPSDILYLDGTGLLVTELQDDRISLLTDTGVKQVFLDEGIEAPTNLIASNSRVYAVDSANQRIVQLTVRGDTAGVLWEAPRGANLLDVSMGPDGNVWVLDDQQYRFHVISPDGVPVETHAWNRNLDLEKIWWRRDTLIAVGSRGIVTLDPDGFEPRALSVQGETLPGSDVSDIHLTGDRFIIASFESSELLIYRPPTIPDPDMLVDSRRFDFRDFPIVRGTVIVQDPLGSHRFEHLGDGNLEIDVNNLDILPSILRHTQTTYGNDWVMLVDNRLGELRAWEEIRPYLERVIDQAPDGSRGSLWSVTGRTVIEQGFTQFSTELKNTLNQLDVYSERDVTRNDTKLARRMNQAFNTFFARRSSGGLIVVTRHVNELSSRLRRLTNRAVNNSTPVVVINPGSESLDTNHPFREADATIYQNFGRLNVRALWNHYRSFQNHHYTVVYRSNLRYQPSSYWQTFEFGFHYFDRIFRYRGGFMIP